MTERTHILRVNPLFLFEEAITVDQFEKDIETVIKGYSSTTYLKILKKLEMNIECTFKSHLKIKAN